MDEARAEVDVHVVSAPNTLAQPMPAESVAAADLRKAKRAPKSGERARSTPLKVFSTWAVVLVLTTASIVALGLHLRLFYEDPPLFRMLVVEHVRALIGIPLAAASAFCILLIFEARAGEIEFKALGFRFRGGSGPAVIWVFSFLAIVAAIRLLW